MEIIILKTNIKHKKQVKQISYLLNNEEGICRWNIALDDIDKVLRVETTSMAASDIIKKVEAMGFTCEELAD